MKPLNDDELRALWKSPYWDAVVGRRYRLGYEFVIGVVLGLFVAVILF